MSDIKTRHIIALLLENESGALSRVSGLFSARSYNIESLTVAPTDDSTLSRMTIVTYGTEDIVEQITKQLNKLVDVVRVQELTKVDFVEREMALIKLLSCVSSIEKSIGLKRPGISVDKLSNFSSRFSILGSVF